MTPSLLSHSIWHALVASSEPEQGQNPVAHSLPRIPGSCSTIVKGEIAPRIAKLPGGYGRERMEAGNASLLFIVNIGWDSDLLPFGKISGKGFVARKLWSLPEHLTQEKNKDWGGWEGDRDRSNMPQ